MSYCLGEHVVREKCMDFWEVKKGRGVVGSYSFQFLFMRFLYYPCWEARLNINLFSWFYAYNWEGGYLRDFCFMFLGFSVFLFFSFSFHSEKCKHTFTWSSLYLMGMIFHHSLFTINTWFLPYIYTNINMLGGLSLSWLERLS